MFATMFIAVIHFAHADSLDCYAKCVVLQTGPEADLQIKGKARDYATSTRLVKYVGRVFGESIESVREACEERSRDVDWWHPPQDEVRGVLVKSITVDESDVVKAVVSYQELKTCERFSNEVENGRRFDIDRPGESE